MATATVSFFNFKKSFLSVLLLGLFALSAGCGDNDAFTASDGTTDNTGTDTGGGNPPPITGPVFSTPSVTPHTIVLSAPVEESITDIGGGFYRRIVTAMVTDQDGNAVADGTIVQLNVIDSVIARGSLLALNDAISGSTLTDNDVLDAGFNATTMDGAYVIRNAAHRFIETGDRLFLINADGEDKDRVVNRSGITATTVNVTDPFSNNYPNNIYDGSTLFKTTSYVIGASLLGAEVAGEDESGNLTTGVASTVDGLARFRITYPANVGSILTGCGGIPAVDTRAYPTGSADVYLVATVTDAVTTVDGGFCFTHIAGETLVAVPSSLTASGNVTVTLRDGHSVRLPFYSVTATVVDANGSNIELGGAGIKTLVLSTNSGGSVTFPIDVTTPPTSGSATVNFEIEGLDGIISTSISVSSNAVTPVTP